MAIRLMIPGLRHSLSKNALFECSSSELQFEARIFSRQVTSRAASAATGKISLRSEILKLKCQESGGGGSSATAVLQNWADNGRKIPVSELRFLSRKLIKSKRYNHALQILTWMEDKSNVRMIAEDNLNRIEMIIKLRGLEEAEEYFFTRITSHVSQKAAAFPLVHGYVQKRDIEKAEALMMKLNGLGLLVSPHLFNEMMKLYVATSRFEKVEFVIEQMKRNKIPRNVLSYNLWMNACGEASRVGKVEMVYKEMVEDENVEVGWSSMCTLANIYIKAGIVDKALLALENAEQKLSTSKRLGYFFLITLYSSLKNKKGVLRLWTASKAVGGRITCADYMCVISSLVKVGDLVEAERVFKEWESRCRNYDIRVSNVLLGAYVRNGLINKAESLHFHTLERGAYPNYKTWEILMEGWVRSQKMDKAIKAMKEGFAMLKHCDWRPSNGILIAVAEYLEKNGNLKFAIRYIRMIHHFGLASLPLYKLLLQMHVCAQKPALDILNMMEKDNIQMDDETSALVQALNLNA